MTLTTLYASASEDQRERGRAWYPAMRRAVARIARDTGTPLHRAVACAAITSPDAQLRTNLKWTRQVCEGDRGGRYPARMTRACRAILSGEVSPGAGVGGPKVTAFYRAIIGDTDSVVLDRWALRAAGHPRDTCTPLQYRRYAGTFREAAAECGETPREFQAIIWIVLRERYTRRNGTRVRLADIHNLTCLDRRRASCYTTIQRERKG